VSLTILYRNPKRPDEDGMTMIAGQVEAASVLSRLEKHGLVVVKVTFVPFATAPPTPANQSESCGLLDSADYPRTRRLWRSRAAGLPPKSGP
jgi:hypothetical protein